MPRLEETGGALRCWRWLPGPVGVGGDSVCRVAAPSAPGASSTQCISWPSWEWTSPQLWQERRHSASKLSIAQAQACSGFRPGGSLGSARTQASLCSPKADAGSSIATAAQQAQPEISAPISAAHRAFLYGLGPGAHTQGWAGDCSSGRGHSLLQGLRALDHKLKSSRRAFLTSGLWVESWQCQTMHWAGNRHPRQGQLFRATQTPALLQFPTQMISLGLFILPWRRGVSWLPTPC